MVTTGKKAKRDRSKEVVDRILGYLEDGDGVFPPKLDDIICADLLLIRWRAQAPPREVEAVRRCYGEAHALLLYAESDAAAEGRPLNAANRRRVFLRAFAHRARRITES